jgi:Outer membrane protein
MKHLVLLLFILFPAISYSQQTLTLEECRNLAIQNNKDLQISGRKVKMADAEKKAAFTKYFPQITASGLYSVKSEDLSIFDPEKVRPLVGSGALPPELLGLLQFDLDRSIWVGDISLVQPVFAGGKIISYNHIAKYAKQLAESMNDQTLQEVLCRTDETYWQVISFANKKTLADSYVDLLRKMESDVMKMIDEGVATKADGLMVSVKLNEAEMAQTRVNNGLALTKMVLAQICGLDLETPITLVDEFIENVSLQTDNTIADVNDAFLNRPELKSLDLVTKIYEKKEKITFSEMLPNVALTAGYITTNPSAISGLKSEFGGMFTVGVMMKVPISGWWEGMHKKNAARSETVIKHLELEDVRDKVELQVNQSIYKKNEANKKLAASIKNMDKANENLRFAELGFREGVIPSLNLMEAQTAWFSAHSALIDSQIEVKLSEVYLNKALGILTVE